MSSRWSDLTTRVSPEPIPDVDYFDLIPDSILLLILNMTSDVKSLGRCSAVSHRLRLLVPQVHSVLVRVDCVISDDDPPSSSSSSSIVKPRSTNPFLLFFSSLFKPLHVLIPRRIMSCAGAGVGVSGSGSGSSSVLAVGNNLFPTATTTTDSGGGGGGVTHHSPTQVLRNFTDLRFLRIELPSGELGVDDGVLLRWKAHFGSTLDSCVILGASSVTYPSSSEQEEDYTKLVSNEPNGARNGDSDDNGSIPESFYTNGGLKLRVVWTISSLIAASARHYLLQQIIAEHKTLDSLILTDSDGQGVLCMNKEQLEELRVKPLSASAASKRTLVPALNMRLWYAPTLELGDGTVLRGATLVAIRPSEAGKRGEEREGEWVEGAFEEPFGMAARMLVKRRTYCLEMNSF